MNCYIHLCIVLTLAYQGLTRSINSINSDGISSAIPIFSKNIPVISSLRCIRNNGQNCPQNMMPCQRSRNENTVDCYCPPRFLYYSLNNTCHEVYRQGPCQPGYYVYQSVNETGPRCHQNPCIIDGLVQFNGTCYSLGSREPCLNGQLIVDPYSLQIQCRGRTVAYAASIARAPPIPSEPPCPPNTRRPEPGAGCKIVV